MYAESMELFSLIISLAAELAKLARTLVSDGMRFIASLARIRTALAAENLFLRKQLAFYQERKIKPRRFDNITRFMLVLLSRGFAWQDALVNVTPKTFTGWHRDGEAAEALRELLESDPVLPGDAAAHGHAQLKDLRAEALGRGDLVRAAGIVKDQRMQVAVPGMEDVGHLQPVLAGLIFDSGVSESRLTIPAPHGLPGAGDATVYRVYAGQSPVAALYVVSARDGYAAAIRLLIGVGCDGNISGVHVLAHRETPGLGDQVETSKSDWVRQFAGRSLGDPAVEDWRIERDGGAFDQLTGASVTPRAIVKAVRQTLEYHAVHADAVFAAATDDQEGLQQ